uniref:Uncharacterized protein n=1 Tax=mine drainage metagenome TaxID=410659 RepID=E6PZK5_9ZZZZ
MQRKHYLYGSVEDWLALKLDKEAWFFGRFFPIIYVSTDQDMVLRILVD